MIATRLFTSAPAGWPLPCCSPPFSSAFAQEASAPVAEPRRHTFTANVSLVSDYRYRGISQTNLRPAIQGGFDYSHASGFYVGNWNSSISWLERCRFVGVGARRNGFLRRLPEHLKLAEQEFNYDVGVLEYYYRAATPRRARTPPKFTPASAGARCS
jgi:uncharacterized protein (TIGR02001 family)